MSDNANSVNIKHSARGYHHGALRPALIDAGLTLLDGRAVDDLSLREVARRVGVSPTAVYRHFPDKQALVGALCEAVANDLAAEQKAAHDTVMAAGGSLRAAFAAMGQTYVRFALAHPARFRVMMSAAPPVAPSDMVRPDGEQAVNRAMQQLRACVAELLPPDASDKARDIAAIRAWSLVHGMAMLMLDGMIPPDEAIIGSLNEDLDLLGSATAR
jgi:AcrR family transcriptional regulator